MKFKKGCKVEILSKKDGSWICAEIISGNGHTYRVKRGWFPMTKEAVEERVARKTIRPHPPPVEGAENWAAGDHVEVFQNASWKTATIVEVFGDYMFLVRLLKVPQEFRIHKRNVRFQQSWQDGKWFVVGKGSATCTTSTNKNQTDTNTKLCVAQQPCISTRTLKRGSPNDLMDLETDLDVNATIVQKVRTIKKNRSAQQMFLKRPSSLHEDEVVNTRISPKEKLGKKYTPTSWCTRTLGLSEKDACRGPSTPVNTSCRTSLLGSCSANTNDLLKSPFHFMKHNSENTLTPHTDAKSLNGRGDKEEGCFLNRTEDLAIEVHWSELFAYHRTIEALFSFGPLSWEDEARLTDIRIAHNISDDEHLEEIRNLIAADTRIPFC